MANLQTMIQELYEAGRHPAQTIRAAMEETGKPAVGLFPLFLPEELVYKAGYLPVGLWGGVSNFQLADKYIQSFCCSIMRANLELALTGGYDFLKAILVPSQCDTLKCVCENMKVALPNMPIIGVTTPHNRTIEGAKVQLLQEFDYIEESLAGVDSAGTQPMPLEEAFAVYEAYRAVMKDFLDTAPRYLNTINAKVRHYLVKAGWFMDKKAYTAKMQALLEVLKSQPEEAFTGTRFVATGIMIDSEPVLDLLVDLDIAIVDDLLCHESMQFRTKTRGEGTTAEKLAGRILDLQAASVLYEPMKPRGKLLAEMAKEKKADAVLFCLMKFCDPEAFDQPLVKKDLTAAGVPMLSIEIDQMVESLGQLRTRIQAFCELSLV